MKRIDYLVSTIRLISVSIKGYIIMEMQVVAILCWRSTVHKGKKNFGLSRRCKDGGWN